MASSSAAATPRLRCRDIHNEDIEDLFKWKNDELSVKMSQSQRSVSWDEHVSWVNAALADDNKHFFLFEDAGSGEKIGVVRFDIDGDAVATVSINLAPEARGRALSKTCLAMGVDAFVNHRRCKIILAHIRPDNRASRRIFSAVGFELRAEKDDILEYSLSPCRDLQDKEDVVLDDLHQKARLKSTAKVRL